MTSFCAPGAQQRSYNSRLTWILYLEWQILSWFFTNFVPKVWTTYNVVSWARGCPRINAKHHLGRPLFGREY